MIEKLKKSLENKYVKNYIYLFYFMQKKTITFVELRLSQFLCFKKLTSQVYFILWHHGMFLHLGWKIVSCGIEIFSTFVL
jgi:hypothetical protein